MDIINQLKQKIKDQANQFGFLEINFATLIIPNEAQDKFNQWIENNYHGEMNYLANNRELRFNPKILHDGTLSIISVKAPYLQNEIKFHKQRLNNPEHAYVSSYALGRDYHKVVKQNLNNLAQWISAEIANLETLQSHLYRVFTDSAPIMEVLLASLAGSGWRGKNTLLINKNHGSMFFLGEIFSNIPFTADVPTSSHCGSCSKCLDVCPTQAFISPYVLDARKCISYLTIENDGAIPLELRTKIGNRIYGCDDCQLFCPWNKFSQLAALPDFKVRNNLDSSSLLELFAWSEDEFRQRLQGSPIHRIGYNSWLRNLAIGIGNSPYSEANISALTNKCSKIDNMMVQEHIKWAIAEQEKKLLN